MLYGIAAALPHMQRQKSGHFINVSSVAGHRVGPGSDCAARLLVPRTQGRRLAGVTAGNVVKFVVRFGKLVRVSR